MQTLENAKIREKLKGRKTEQGRQRRERERARERCVQRLVAMEAEQGQGLCRTPEMTMKIDQSWMSDRKV